MKRTLILSLVCMLAVGTAFPQVLFAQEEAAGPKPASPEPAGSITVPGGRGICLVVDQVESRIDQIIATNGQRIEQKREELRTTILERRQRLDTRLAEVRDDATQKRQELYAALQQVIESAEDQEAVTTFANTVEQAVQTRTAAVDAAGLEYQEGINQALVNHKTGADTARATYKAALADALQKAQSDCDSGFNSATILTQLRKGGRVAFDVYRTQLLSLDTIKEQHRILSDTLREKRQAAFDAYRETVRKAQDDLKAALRS